MNAAAAPSPAAAPRAAAAEAALLVSRLGDAGEALSAAGLAAALALPALAGREELPAFLATFRERLLLGVELPAVYRAAGHAAAGEARELVALDAALAPRFPRGAFAAASRRVGRHQLRRLHPLRDVRVVRRYLAAVEAGAAPGHHVVVFGLVVGVFMLPPRPALAHYALVTHGTLARLAGAPLGADEACLAALEAAARGEVEAALHALLPPAPPHALA
jgi:urease accessory protein UreF